MKICLYYFLLFTICVAPGLANDTSDIPRCVADDDCDADRVCAKQKCVNPCEAVCGANTLSRDQLSTDWVGAITACLRNNSQLAAIDNSEELDEIRQLIRQTGLRRKAFWLSGSDHGHEGHFIWASTGRPITTPSDMWLPGEPNNLGVEGEQCVCLWESSPGQGYALNDGECPYRTFFVCQYFVE